MIAYCGYFPFLLYGVIITLETIWTYRREMIWISRLIYTLLLKPVFLNKYSFLNSAFQIKLGIVQEHIVFSLQKLHESLTSWEFNFLFLKILSIKRLLGAVQSTHRYNKQAKCVDPEMQAYLISQFYVSGDAQHVITIDEVHVQADFAETRKRPVGSRGTPIKCVLPDV
ncbi:hypothetical protein ACJX0J_021633, partial [Zea mays]